MIRALLIGCLLLLAACASQPPLPVHTPSLALPLQLHIEREQDGQRQDWLLVIQREGEALRWSLMDPLGIPRPGKSWWPAVGRQMACYRPTPRPASCLRRCCSP